MASANNLSTPLPSRTGRTNTPHTASYPDPIAVRAGDPLAVSDRSERWRDHPQWIWVWCTGPDGRRGWVPNAYIEQSDNHATIRCNFDAMELTIEAGADVVVEREESGWLWCATTTGAHGWIPRENVTL